ncbi:MAG: type II secretion system minor pseudopilin GspK [Endozoicomonas sp.]|uniref:type II secretion system minor pseudopilin GspK n=1 Tax=Endozoicomonas sp. TaxID=1892382 RepID=UPI003D9B20F2
MTLMRRQKGVALLYVLMIFAVITVMSSRMLSDLWLHTSQNTSYLERVQAKQYALGAEQYAAFLLEEDAKSDNEQGDLSDNESEVWNIKQVAYEVEQGALSINVIDASSKLNLNGLLLDENKRRQYAEVIKRLLRNLEQKQDLVMAMEDWLDDNQEPLAQGAEDNTYLMAAPAYRAADTEFASVSELRLIDGVSHEVYLKLLPYFTALPVNNSVNLNTAPEEVLLALSDNLTEEDVLGLINLRADQRLASMEDLHVLTGLKNKLGAQKAFPMAFNSHYFLVYAHAQYRDTDYYLQSLLYRSPDGKVSVLEREVGLNPDWKLKDEEV